MMLLLELLLTVWSVHEDLKGMALIQTGDSSEESHPIISLNYEQAAIQNLSIYIYNLVVAQSV